jgi:hypothetical protein
VAYIHDVDTKVGKEYYSKLVKSDGDKDEVLQYVLMLTAFVLHMFWWSLS